MWNLALGDIWSEAQLILRGLKLFLLCTDVHFLASSLINDVILHQLVNALLYSTLWLRRRLLFESAQSRLSFVYSELGSSTILANLRCVSRYCSHFLIRCVTFQKLGDPLIFGQAYRLFLFCRLSRIHLRKLFLSNVHLNDLLVSNLRALRINLRSESAGVHRFSFLLSSQWTQLCRSFLDIPFQFIVVAIWLIQRCPVPRWWETCLCIDNLRLVLILLEFSLF